jgi:hypothetical protein
MMARRRHHKPTYSLRRDNGRPYIPSPASSFIFLYPMVELVD